MMIMFSNHHFFCLTFQYILQHNYFNKLFIEDKIKNWTFEVKLIFDIVNVVGGHL